MPIPCSRRQFLINALGGTFATATVGCGMLLHPDRVGQPAGDLDWQIVALDAMGLLLFIIPGVIAFAVDFSMGTIYLPSYGLPGVFEVSGKASGSKADSELNPMNIPVDELSRDRIEEVVSGHVGTRVELEPGRYRAAGMKHISQFTQESRRIADSGGHSHVRFRCQSPR